MLRWTELESERAPECRLSTRSKPGPGATPTGRVLHSAERPAISCRFLHGSVSPHEFTDSAEIVNLRCQAGISR
jgi:hypothetical protein